jgi:hypothetical protein
MIKLRGKPGPLIYEISHQGLPVGDTDERRCSASPDEEWGVLQLTKSKLAAFRWYPFSRRMRPQRPFP